MVLDARPRWRAGSGRGCGRNLFSTLILHPRPPRTGTSWLHEILRGRAVLPSSAKETRFFDSHFHRGMDWYRAHYPKTIDGRCIGEVAPTYFASAEARERIAKLFPQA